jgi:hypothetical protein
MVAFGIIGFLVFLWGLFFPVLYKISKGTIRLPMLIFLGISLLSMFNEDTLETQAGALFFAFFYTFFFWGANPQSGNEQIHERTKVEKTEN